MHNTFIKLLAVGVVTAGLGFSQARAQATFAIKLPAHSRLTPVQRLNREGVEAINKHDYSAAAALFYKAYLYDPADPFTLNNLGYISELQGQPERADAFYKLASEQGSNADIELSNVQGLEGKPMKAAIEDLHDAAMKVNDINLEANRLLAEGRSFEAAGLLEQALAMSPQNAFTLNNLGVADEAIGDRPGALKYFNQAAESRSSEKVVATENRPWSGKPVSDVAAANAARLETLMQQTGAKVAQADLYNLRGVYAENENDPSAAKQDFLFAYSLDPGNAFSLNNRGYVAEMEGDLESAQFFYEKAQHAGGSNLLVGLATESAARGQPLFRVATESGQKVDGALSWYSEERRQQQGPIELTPRGGATLWNSPAAPKQSSSPQTPHPSTPTPPLH